MSVETHKETLGFNAEVTQLLNLMIHSLYSNKEIFLRELISNSSDAADKLRFEALTDDALYENDTDLRIQVDFDKDKRTITIRDNGIGMSRSEVIDHIGTIARSGTKQFFESLTGDQAKDSRLIGQFGVGFYSSFIVADKVTLRTRRAGTGAEHGVMWESEGKGDYTLETIERPERGTEIVLHLRKDEDEFLDHYRLRHVINKYSDHITLPIQMKPPTPGEKDKNEEQGEWETVNSASALWSRAKKEIKDEEYREFYKHVAHDFDEPLCWTHNRVEGKQEYTSLLYIPKRAPFDLWDRQSRHGIKLYVRRVFIMDDAEQLMPVYLRFVRGIIDSSDLPLNVSREILQQSREIDSIRSGSVKKVLGLLESVSKNQSEDYALFWNEFGAVLKEGIVEDHANAEAIARLLRFNSTHNEVDEQNVSLTQYIERMPEGQDKIYYITAETPAAARHSPHLEIFKKKGIEVLLLTDRVDEWMLGSLSEFEGHSLQSVAKGDLDLGKLEDKKEKEKQETLEKEFSDITDRVHKALEDKVQEVRLTHRLTDSPSCLVANAGDISGNLERILKAAGQAVPENKPVLEINPEHPLTQRLKGEVQDERFRDWARILFDQALLSEGGQLDDPSAFVRRINSLLLELDSKPE